MNIKSLLFGSAAALVAVSGARAADAVVMAEPEPMEYVRICDMYGTGFFYIPGTETCLKIGGYIRAEIRGGDLFDSPEDSYNTLTRFSLQTDTRNETEYGTLQSYTETRFNYANGGIDNIDLPGGGEVDLQDTGVSLNFAWIDLAGFRIGKGETAFDTFTGYAGNVIADDTGVPYGPFDTNFVWYQANFGAVSAILSLEEGDASDELQTYVPHVVGGLKYDGGVFAVAGVAAYDSNNQEFAGKVRVDIKPSDQFYGFIMGGYKTDDGDDDVSQIGKSSDGTNYYGNWEGGDEDEVNGGDGFAVWGGFSYVFTPQVTLNTQASYDEGENFAAVANINFRPVTGLQIIPEIVYADNFQDGRGGASGAADDDNNDGEFGGILRVQRDF